MHLCEREGKQTNLNIGVKIPGSAISRCYMAYVHAISRCYRATGMQSVGVTWAMGMQ